MEQCDWISECFSHMDAYSTRWSRAQNLIFNPSNPSNSNCISRTDTCVNDPLFIFDYVNSRGATQLSGCKPYTVCAANIQANGVSVCPINPSLPTDCQANGPYCTHTYDTGNGSLICVERECNGIGSQNECNSATWCTWDTNSSECEHMNDACARKSLDACPNAPGCSLFTTCNVRNFKLQTNYIVIFV